MRRRMWEYNVNMDIMENMPVYSVLVYVMKEDDDKEDTLVGSPYVREIPGTGMGHHFTFQVIKLWEIAPEVAKRPGFEVLLPLLPLTKGGKNLETVDDMINELVARNRADLLGLGQFCAGLVFKDEISQQWLKERFDKVLEIIQESWVYQRRRSKKVVKKVLRKVLRKAVNKVWRKVWRKVLRKVWRKVWRKVLRKAVNRVLFRQCNIWRSRSLLHASLKLSSLRMPLLP